MSAYVAAGGKKRKVHQAPKNAQAPVPSALAAKMVPYAHYAARDEWFQRIVKVEGRLRTPMEQFLYSTKAVADLTTPLGLDFIWTRHPDLFLDFEVFDLPEDHPAFVVGEKGPGLGVRTVQDIKGEGVTLGYFAGVITFYPKNGKGRLVGFPEDSDFLFFSHETPSYAVYIDASVVRNWTYYVNTAEGNTKQTANCEFTREPWMGAGEVRLVTTRQVAAGEELLVATYGPGHPVEPYKNNPVLRWEVVSESD